MKIEAGKTYLNRRGEQVTVESSDDGHGSLFLFQGKKYWYAHNGRLYSFVDSSEDLIAEAPKEDARVDYCVGYRDYDQPGPVLGTPSAEDARALVEEISGLEFAPVTPTKRKIVQIAAAHDGGCIALCEDGTLFQSHIFTDTGAFSWVRIPEIPQP